LHKRVIDKLS